MREGPMTVMRRCLALLRRLQRGPASKAELIEWVLAKVDEEAYSNTSGEALDKRFEYDKTKLRELFGLRLYYSRATACYTIADVELPWLDVPDEALATLAFLQETFGPAAPQHGPVQELLRGLARGLPAERHRELEQQRLAWRVEWGQRDADVIAPEVEAGLTRALIERRLIAFDYCSPSNADGQPRRHTVEPWERYFDSVWGHCYLYGYCQRIIEPDGEVSPLSYFRYRLGRMSNLAVLPSKLPPRSPAVPQFELVYRLEAEVARQGDVTRHPSIRIGRTEPRPDGSVVVYAQTGEVWWAVRSLLHYGPNCQVLGGKEALIEMRQVVGGMAGVYGM